MSQLMNGAQTWDLSILGALLTTTFMVFFLGWTYWAYAPSQREKHEASGRMPLDGGEA